MKIGVDQQKPDALTEVWPGMLDYFHHMEFLCAVPQLLCAITTRKANGLPNLNYHCGGTIQGDAGGYFAILAGVGQHTHAYADIMRTRAFCVNFLSLGYRDAVFKTIEGNDPAADEIALAGLTCEDAATVAAPRIAESFLTLECRLEWQKDLSGAGLTALVTGRVLYALVEENSDVKYGPEGFNYYASHSFDTRRREFGPDVFATLLPHQPD